MGKKSWQLNRFLIIFVTHSPFLFKNKSFLVHSKNKTNFSRIILMIEFSRESFIFLSCLRCKKTCYVGDVCIAYGTKL
jgi:hypothetical protein